MTVECTPAIARAAATNLTTAFTSVGTAATSLFTTSAANQTTDLTVGLSVLTSECVEETGLISSILRSLALAVEGADAFGGSEDFFANQADSSLAALLRSLSDGRGDHGGNTAQQRVDELTDSIWPGGVPSGLTDAELVESLLTGQRALTLTPEELAAIWPLLPAAGREHFAGAEPVAVLDLVIDGGLILTDTELDAATVNILADIPTVPNFVDPDLADQLDATSSGRFGLPRLDRSALAIDRADVLIGAGQAGRDYRDAVNHPVTYVALAVGLQSGGAARRTDDGLIVVTVPADAEVSLNDLIGSGSDFAVAPFGRGGTTYGNTFIVPDTNRVDDDLLNHENIHTYQWAGAGPVEYPVLYGVQSGNSAITDITRNGLDIDFSLNGDIHTTPVDIGPLGPSGTPSIPIPGADRLPGWFPDRIPSIPLPQLDLPEVRVPVGVSIDPDIEFEAPNAACGNAFEQHADLEHGNYGCDDY